MLTAPIEGQIESVSKNVSNTAESGDSLARISNVRVDRGTLISLEEKAADARAKLEATRQKKESDRTYVKMLDAEINDQSEQLRAQFQSQIAGLRAKIAETNSLSGAQKALVDRQSEMVARNAASMDMLRPTKENYSAALHKADAARAGLDQKVAQLDALEKGIYAGDDLVAIGILAQKRRDISLDATRMEIEEKELSAILQDKQALAAQERQRLAILTEADVQVTNRGKILTVGATPGRHVNAGDTLASLVDCEKRFVVAIFSYRQAQSMKPGTRVRVEGAAFGSGIVTAILPKTSDKVDERFAVPFPQTERRELYAIIAPENSGSGGQDAEPAADEGSRPCTIGQWVTVTKDNAMVPSTSVMWRHLETLVSSWSADESPAQPNDNREATRETGIAALTAAFRSAAAARQPSMP
ncbi:HlyD family efflux transporter periplasmic adaptor subunit [Bradyrhizobium lablabi]|uniref:HlyD family efflux transporter periplasmic adaptor subunit n=1 Tax=Bradyrhizobium lablabi TaxID=722472 RepID=UPI002011A6F0|nr:HlyD family efflux transporter periplasmic adaptor subunit [Bradyrhizobium lablabi]